MVAESPKELREKYVFNPLPELKKDLAIALTAYRAYTHQTNPDQTALETFERIVNNNFFGPVYDALQKTGKPVNLFFSNYRLIQFHLEGEGQFLAAIAKLDAIKKEHPVKLEAVPHKDSSHPQSIFKIALSLID